ncbi:MAG: Gfo/Idh/MocA family oxidoreductase [Sphingobium sp.]|nr:Gfo/Idh/MocA family oxidoreductase [Sphingobium sp.]
MLGVAIIGLGMAATPHALSLLDLSDRARVIWAATPNPVRAAAFGRAYPFAVTTNVAAAIRDPAVDCVLLLTPPATHCELALAAFSVGKHVLVEKPLALDVESGRVMLAAAEAAGRQLGVVLQHRFRPGPRRLRELLADGALGAVVHAHLNVPWWRAQSYYDEPGRGTYARDGGGVLMTQAIHSLDLLRALVGPLHVVSALARTTPLHVMEAEDLAAALFRLSDGGTASMVATTASYPGTPETLEVIGTSGTAQLVGGTLHVSLLNGFRENVASDEGTGHGAGAMDFSHHAHRALIADFLSSIALGRPPMASGSEALDTQILIQSILRSARGGA